MKDLPDSLEFENRNGQTKKKRNQQKPYIKTFIIRKLKPFYNFEQITMSSE